MWILLYYFHRIYACRKNILDYTNFFSPNDYKKNDKILCKHFKDKFGKESNVEFRLRKLDETRYYLLDEIIKHNDLMSENYKKTCKYLNYAEH